MEAIPKFLQGVFAFSGAGLDNPSPLGSLAYTVPSAKRAQFVYLRAGNSSGELAVVSLIRDGKVMRFFPVGARASEHVPLTVVEDLEPDTKIEVMIAAPAGTSGHLVLDLGILEI